MSGTSCAWASGGVRAINLCCMRCFAGGRAFGSCVCVFIYCTCIKCVCMCVFMCVHECVHVLCITNTHTPLRKTPYHLHQHLHHPHTLYKHWATKSLNANDHFSLSLSVGGGSREIINITRMGCTLQRGGDTSAISIALIPNAHMSTFPSYRDSWITSGAIQWGVPIKVLRLLLVSVSWAATPKSASLTSPRSVNRILPHL